MLMQKPWYPKHIKRLVKNGQDPNFIDSRGVSALYIAIISKQVELVEWLVKKGADSGKAACCYPNLELAVMREYGINGPMYAILARHVDPEPLYKAAWDGDLETVQQLFPTNNDRPNNKMIICFLRAFLAQQMEVVDWLWDYTYTPNAVDLWGISIFHLAAATGNVELVKWLHEEKGMDIFGTDGYGATPMLQTVREGHLKLAQYLVSRGGNIHDKYDNGNTAFQEAACHGKLNVLHWLLTEMKYDRKDERTNAELYDQHHVVEYLKYNAVFNAMWPTTQQLFRESGSIIVLPKEVRGKIALLVLRLESDQTNNC